MYVCEKKSHLSKLARSLTQIPMGTKNISCNVKKCGYSEDSDQPAHQQNLFSGLLGTFAKALLISMVKVLKFPISSF